MLQNALHAVSKWAHSNLGLYYRSNLDGSQRSCERQGSQLHKDSCDWETIKFSFFKVQSCSIPPRNCRDYFIIVYAGASAVEIFWIIKNPSNLGKLSYLSP